MTEHESFVVWHCFVIMCCLVVLVPCVWCAWKFLKNEEDDDENPTAGG